MVFYGCRGKGIYLHLSPVRILKKQPANTDLAVVCVIFGFYLQFSERFKKGYRFISQV